jgi:molybdopterin converting factor small subunit
MARTDPQINLRVPANLKKKIELIAIENSRSTNAEVVQRLEQSFEQNLWNLENVPTEELMKELAKRCSVLEIKLR